MQRNHLILGMAVALMNVPIASAAFLGIGVYQLDDFFDNAHPEANVQAAWDIANPGGVGLDVYRIYAEFDTDDENVVAVFGEASTNRPAYMTNLTSGSFWNYTEFSGFLHFDIAPMSSQFSLVSKAAEAFDTFATIGAFADDTATNLAIDMVNFLNITNHLQTNWNTNDTTNGTGGWEDMGFPPQGVPLLQQQGLPEDGVYRVLLMQVTVVEADVFEGVFGVKVSSGIRGATEYYNATPNVPGSTFFTNADTSVPEGACCFADDSCAVFSETDCATNGGTYQGDDTNCGEVVCVTVEPCPADLDDSGTVNVFDLLELLLAWGQSGVPADIDSSGTVNVFDLLELLLAWGSC